MKDFSKNMNPNGKMDLAREAKEIERISGRIVFLEKSLAESKTSLQQEEKNFEDSKKAQELLQLAAQAIQQQAHQKISHVVSSCLSSVFDNPYEFHIVFEKSRGRTKASLRFRRDGLDLDPINAAGGGMIDVAAFALRVACLMLHRPRLGRIVVLDEPFRFVSEQYQGNVRQMLERLAVDLKLQIVMVTHVDPLATGKIITLEYGT